MPKHKTGTREDWLAARLQLLKAEKELMHRSDELARRRQELPWAMRRSVTSFTAHVNVGFFLGAQLADPARLLEGTGKYMRHVKIRPGTESTKKRSPH